MQRNTVISICKALAIILMVIGHADAPEAIHLFLYEFHMPVFFITAGFFFSLRYLTDEATFVKKRFKGLYVPFLKWAVFFLIIHNWMFDLGILNEQYGNWTGGVTHPYSWHLPHRQLIAPIGVCVFMLLLAAWKTSEGLRIITLIQGGYREIMGTFFFGVGFLFRKWEQHYRVSWWMTIVFAVIVALYSQYLTANMNWRSSFIQFLSLPVPAICGFLMTYNIATWLNRYDGVVKRFLVFCGDNTLPIFVFHIISFKLVSLLKIWYYDLDFAQIGCHMVIHDHAKDDFFWILYTIVGVGIPLGFTWCSQHIRKAQQPPSSLPAAD